MINSAERQLTSSRSSGFQSIISASNGACEWFPREGYLRITSTTRGVLSSENKQRACELQRKLLTTQGLKGTHAIAVVGWGFFLRHENGFVAVPGEGLSLFVLDGAAQIGWLHT